MVEMKFVRYNPWITQTKNKAFMHRFEDLIGKAVKRDGYTGPFQPRVAGFLVDKFNPAKDLDTRYVKFSSSMMEDIGAFLESKGVSMDDGISVVKAEAAADALVLNAKSKEGHDLIIKMVTEKGLFEKHPDFHDPILQEAIMQSFPSSIGPNQTVLVRIEPKGLPVDKAIAHLPRDERLAISEAFKKRVHADLKARGVGGNDIKMNNFIVPVGSQPNSLEEIMALQPKLIDIDALVIPSGSSYVPRSHPNPPTHVDDLFKPTDLPKLSGAQATAATSAALVQSASAVRS